MLTALDNAGGVFEAILPSLSAIEVALDGRITAGSVVCSDGTAAYVKAAVKAVFSTKAGVGSRCSRPIRIV